MPDCVKCKSPLPEGANFCPSCGKRQTARPERKALKRANGMGSVYKLSGRRKRPWVASRSRVIIGYYETKTAALEALERTQGKPLNERYNLTFSEVYEEWKLEKFRDLTVKGVEQYENAYRHCVPLYDRKFRTIRVADCQAIIDTMAEAGLSHSSANKVKQLIGQMSKWAIREDIITKNPAPYLKLPENTAGEKEIFAPEEIETLWTNSGDITVQLILILIYSGMRIGELFTMERDHVDLEAGYMIGGSKTEAGKDRVIPINQKIKPFVQRLYDVSDGPLLIDGYAGPHTVNAFRQKKYYPALDRLGIPRRTPHACRHTFASMMVSAGVRPEVLQKILGHASYTTTADVYVHQDLTTLIDAVSGL